MNKSGVHIIIKRILFSLLLLVLFVPMIQRFTHFSYVIPLDGAFTAPPTPEATWSNWFEGDYQSAQEEFLNFNIGFKPFFVRVYNQISFSLYNQAHLANAVIGKDNYLYEVQYINAYKGEDFIGVDSIKLKVEKLQRVSDTLSKKGVDLIVMLAPGKASFYPEFVPDRFDIKNRTTTNYDVYIEELAKTDIHLLDFKKWFEEQKEISPYPLFPKTGTHWSNYGNVLVADSTIKYINSIQEEKHIPPLQITDIIRTREMRHPADDIEKGMNLLINIPDLEMGYPEVEITTGDCNPKVLTIADSFYWDMYNWKLSERAFDNGQFWFYNVTIYPDSYQELLLVKDVNTMKEVEKNDVVLLLSTEANLRIFAFGFIDELYKQYFPGE